MDMLEDMIFQEAANLILKILFIHILHPTHD